MTNDFINNYFGFNQQQRNGLVVLVFISFFLLAVRVVYPIFIVPGKIVILNLPLLEKKLDDNSKQTQKFSNAAAYSQRKKPVLFAFDPNTVSKDELIQLGFGEKRAVIFLKFRSRGFVFKKKEDLQKVFGVQGRLYESLEPYISIVHKARPNAETFVSEAPITKPAARVKRSDVIVELNAADSVALEAMEGIGGVFARRILKYRDVLGGYVSADQLKEVYGLNDELFEKIIPFVTVNATLVKKINLNKDDFKTLNKHPYLSYELTKAVFNFRRKTPVTPANLNMVLADNSLCQKLLPYLVFD